MCVYVGGCVGVEKVDYVELEAVQRPFNYQLKQTLNRNLFL